MDWISEDTIMLGLKLLDQIITLYIVYRIIRHLIKYGIDYYYEKRSVELRLKEAREDIKDIETDVKRHMEEDR